MVGANCGRESSEGLPGKKYIQQFIKNHWYPGVRALLLGWRISRLRMIIALGSPPGLGKMAAFEGGKRELMKLYPDGLVC